jgi:hypothetical protein
LIIRTCVDADAAVDGGVDVGVCVCVRVGVAVCVWVGDGVDLGVLVGVVVAVDVGLDVCAVVGGEVDSGFDVCAGAAVVVAVDDDWSSGVAVGAPFPSLPPLGEGPEREGIPTVIMAPTRRKRIPAPMSANCSTR